MPFADLPTGARLHYIDTAPDDADKPVALLVHGMLGTAELHFPRVIDWLKPDYRVVGPTLRGYGQSEPKPRQFPRDFYQQDTRDVLALMDALEIDKAHILGYSDGGEIALLAGGMAADRWHSITAWGAVGYYGPAMRPVAQRMFPGSWITQEERDRHGIDNVDAFVLGWIKTAHAIIDKGGDLSLSLAPQISAPLLLMLGEGDTLNPAEYGQRLVDAAQHARLETFKCGHAVHDEAWDEFQRVVGAFLRAGPAHAKGLS